MQRAFTTVSVHRETIDKLHSIRDRDGYDNLAEVVDDLASDEVER